MYTIFPETPLLTDAHRKKFLPVMSNDARLREWLKDSKLPLEDLKRCVLIELESKRPMRMVMLHKLLTRIQRDERSLIERELLAERNRITMRRDKRKTP